MQRFLIAAFLFASAVACQRAGPGWPAPTEIVEFDIPRDNAFPSDVVVDSAGIVWFTDRIVHVIGRIDPATGHIEEHVIPTAEGGPQQLALSKDIIWFAIATTSSGQVVYMRLTVPRRRRRKARMVFVESVDDILKCTGRRPSPNVTGCGCPCPSRSASGRLFPCAASA